MYEVFDSPITKKNMPWAVRDALRFRVGNDLVEISRHSYGTPDGECDTDVWNLTFVNREAQTVIFETYIYKDTSVLALPAIHKTSYWATWQDHGDQYTSILNSDGEYTSKVEEIVIDHDKIHKMINKMLEKKTIDMEAA